MQYVTAIVGVSVVLAACGVPWWFGRRKPGYSHVRHTISELGEERAPDQRLIALAGFVPIGIGLWLWLWLIRAWLPDSEACGQGLLLLGGLGVGYVGGAIFCCDRGAPFWGTRRNRRHNLCAGLGYIGAGIGLLLLGSCFAADEARAGLRMGTPLAGWMALAAIPALSWRQLPIRGLVQRIAEGAIFLWVLVVSLSIL